MTKTGGEAERKSLFKAFAEETSFHSWNHCIRDDRPMVFNLAWLFMITVASVCTVYFVYLDVVEFVHSEVTTSLDSNTVPLAEIHFPAVTICNMNTIRRSFILALMEDEVLSKYDFESLHCGVSQLIHGKSRAGNKEYAVAVAEDIIASHKYNEIFEDFYNTSTHSESGLATTTHVTKFHFVSKEDRDGWETLKVAYMAEVASQYHDYDKVADVSYRRDGELVYVKGFANDVGENCVWMTGLAEPLPNADIFETNPFRYRAWPYGVRKGILHGLKILLDAETFDYTYTKWDNDGFIVSVGHHADVALLYFTGIMIKPGLAFEVGVEPTLYATSDMARWRFSPDGRHCFFEDEVSLGHINGTFRYELTNCFYEAVIQTSLEKCGCTPRLPVNIIEKVCTGGPAKKCLEGVLSDIGAKTTFTDVDGKEVPCFPACEAERFDLVASESNLGNANTFHHTEHFCHVLDKLNLSCRGSRRRAVDAAHPALCSLIEAIPENHRECETLVHDFDLDLAGDSEFYRNLRTAIFDYVARNMVELNVYIRKPYATRYLTDEKVSVIRFIGSIGGLCGLFLGASYMSFMEIFYYALLAAIERWKDRWKRGRASPNSAISNSLPLSQKSVVRTVQPFEIGLEIGTYPFQQ